MTLIGMPSKQLMMPFPLHVVRTFKLNIKLIQMAILMLSNCIILVRQYSLRILMPFWLRNKNRENPPQGSVVRLLARGSAAYRKGLKVLIPPLF